MKKHGFRWISLCMAVLMMLPLAACGDDGETDISSGESGQPAASVAGNDETLSEAESVSEEERASAADPSATVPEGETAAKPDGQAVSSNEEATKPVQSEKVPSTKAEILARYTSVMNKAKSGKPAYKKVEYQEITERNFNGAVDTILKLASGFMTSPEKANKNPENHPKGGDTTWFPVYNGSAGCMIAQQDADKAIKKASCKKLSNGNYQIDITLNSETDPEPLASFHGKMFSPLSRKDIDAELAKISIAKIEYYSVFYHDCTATLIFNPNSNHIVSLQQIMYCKITAKGSVMIAVDGNATLRNTLKITNFQY